MEVLLGTRGMSVGLYVFARMAGWTMFDPLIGRLPVSLRLMIAAALAAALLPGVLATDPPDPFSLAGAMALGGEGLLGALMALCVRILFAAVSAALVWFGETASGGLWVLTPEQAHSAGASLQQLAWWLAVLAFLAANGHLLVVDALLKGLSHLPLAALPASSGIRQIVEGAAWIFVAGSQLALPLMAFALLLHLSLGIIARTEPGVDMFSMGLALGALLLLAGLVWALPLIAAVIEQGLRHLQSWLLAAY